MDHFEFELGLGLFKAFTTVQGKTDSAVQPSVDPALVWLRDHLLVSVMNTGAAVPDCTAAIFDATAEEVAVCSGTAPPTSWLACWTGWPGSHAVLAGHDLRCRRTGPAGGS